MPLIQCPDCSQQVSDQAPACLRCGRPLAHGPALLQDTPVVRTVGAGVRYKVIGALLTIAGMVAGMFIGAAFDHVLGVGLLFMLPGVALFLYGRMHDS